MTPLRKPGAAPRLQVDWADVRRRLAAAADDAGRFSVEHSARILAERAQALARVPAQAAASGSAREFVCFALGTERYAIEAVYVIAVLKLVELTRLPGAPEHLLGITNLRGDILPVFDIRVLLGVARVGISDMSRLLVLGAGNAEIGILADTVDHVGPLDLALALAPTASMSGLGRALVHGVTSEALIVLDGRALLEDRNLFVEDAVTPLDEERQNAS